MTNKIQNKALRSIDRKDIYYALNKYNNMMNENYLPACLCAVCACKFIPKQIQRLSINDIPNFILLAASPQHKTLDISGDWVLLNEAVFLSSTSKCVLDSANSTIDISDYEIDICNMCLRELSKGMLPLRLLASFDIGRIPIFLQEIQLAFAERMLICTDMTVFNIFRVENSIKKHYSIETKAHVSKGHCISFKHSNTKEIIEKFILPHDASTLPKLMITSYIGPAETIEQAQEMVQNAKQLTIRTEIIHIFAKEYACLNPLRVIHDQTRFSNHKSRCVPDILIDMIDLNALIEKSNLQRPFIELDDAIRDGYAKWDHLHPDEIPNKNIQVVQTSGMVLPRSLSNGMEELKNASLRKLNRDLSAIPTETRPVSDYDHEYFVNIYPNIFIHGIGKRPFNVPLTIYLETIMKRQITGATLDYSFPFEARNILLWHRTLQKVGLSLTLKILY